MWYPFDLPDAEFRDSVLNLGNVLHRLRVPHRVDEARSLTDRGVPVEAYDQLSEAVKWLQSYQQRLH